MVNKISYNAQALFVGPSPGSGYHFIDYTGALNDRYYDLAANHNLLKQINRVQNVTISIEAEREEIRQLGTRSLVSRPAINPPQINLEFEYLLNGLANDARVGLDVNYGKFYYPYSGEPFYENNFHTNLLSGLMSRQFDRPTDDPYWPRSMRDNRNIFLVRATEENYDEILRLGEYDFNKPDLTRGVDPKAPFYEVLAMGNCYLNSYTTSAAVNALPTARLSFSCENAAFYLSGSGCFIPAIDTATREQINQNHFNIPEMRDEGGPRVLHPGDILLDFSNVSNMTGQGLNFENLTITDYEISINFNRDIMNSLGHKCPLDREITFPVIANVSFGLIVDALNSGHFVDFLNSDNKFNFSIKLRNPLHCSPFVPIDERVSNPNHAGPAFSYGDIAIRYDIKNAVFESISYNSSIGMAKTASINFSVEIDPDDLTKGLFISGLLNIEKTEDYLLDESGFCVVDENGNPIVTNLIPLF